MSTARSAMLQEDGSALASSRSPVRRAVRLLDRSAAWQAAWGDAVAAWVNLSLSVSQASGERVGLEPAVHAEALDHLRRIRRLMRTGGSLLDDLALTLMPPGHPQGRNMK